MSRAIDIIELLSPYHDRIVDLYVNQRMPMWKVALELGFKGDRVYKYLTLKGLIRKRKGLKPWFTERECDACHAFFRPLGTNTYLCLTCAPHASARIRWGKYGITQSQFVELFSVQGGKCAICPAELTYETANVDHDHVTKRVRGLLCDACNKGLGSFRDNVENLRRAADYLMLPGIEPAVRYLPPHMRGEGYVAVTRSRHQPASDQCQPCKRNPSLLDQSPSEP